MKQIIYASVFIILVFFLSLITSTALNIMEENEGTSQKCTLSKYYKYNHTNVYYTFGKCYVQITHRYQTKEVCRGGVLGIGQSCYEASESHTKFFYTTRCFNPETGESC